MLLITERGHAFTAVEDIDDPSMLFVRSQDRESIEDLATSLEGLTGHRPEVIERPDWDYQFRCHLERRELDAYLSDAVNRISAHKLKPAVAESRGHDHPISHAVFDLFMYLSRNRPDGSVPAWLRR